MKITRRTLRRYVTRLLAEAANLSPLNIVITDSTSPLKTKVNALAAGSDEFLGGSRMPQRTDSVATQSRRDLAAVPVFEWRTTGSGVNDETYMKLLGSSGSGTTDGPAGEKLAGKIFGMDELASAFASLGYPSNLLGPSASSVKDANTNSGVLKISPTAFPGADTWLSRNTQLGMSADRPISVASPPPAGIAANPTPPLETIAGDGVLLFSEVVAASVKASGNVNSANGEANAGWQEHKFTTASCQKIALYLGYEWLVSNVRGASGEPAAVTNLFANPNNKESSALIVHALRSVGVREIRYFASGINLCAIPYFSENTPGDDPLLWGIYASRAYPVRVQLAQPDPRGNFMAATRANLEGCVSQNTGGEILKSRSADINQLIGMISFGTIAEVTAKASNAQLSELTRQRNLFDNDPAFASVVDPVTRYAYAVQSSMNDVREQFKTEIIDGNSSLLNVLDSRSAPGSLFFLVNRMLDIGLKMSIISNAAEQYNAQALADDQISKTSMKQLQKNHALTVLNDLDAGMTPKQQFQAFIKTAKQLTDHYKSIKSIIEKIPVQQPVPLPLGLSDSFFKTSRQKLVEALAQIRDLINAIIDFVKFMNDHKSLRSDDPGRSFLPQTTSKFSEIDKIQRLTEKFDFDEEMLGKLDIQSILEASPADIGRAALFDTATQLMRVIMSLLDDFTSAADRFLEMIETATSNQADEEIETEEEQPQSDFDAPESEEFDSEFEISDDEDDLIKTESRTYKAILADILKHSK